MQTLVRIDDRLCSKSMCPFVFFPGDDIVFMIGGISTWHDYIASVQRRCLSAVWLAAIRACREKVECIRHSVNAQRAVSCTIRPPMCVYCFRLYIDISTQYFSTLAQCLCVCVVFCYAGSPETACFVRVPYCLLSSVSKQSRRFGIYQCSSDCEVMMLLITIWAHPHNAAEVADGRCKIFMS